MTVFSTVTFELRMDLRPAAEGEQIVAFEVASFLAEHELPGVEKSIASSGDPESLRKPMPIEGGLSGLQQSIGAKRSFRLLVDGSVRAEEKTSPDDPFWVRRIAESLLEVLEERPTRKESEGAEWKRRSVLRWGSRAAAEATCSTRKTEESPIYRIYERSGRFGDEAAAPVEIASPGTGADRLRLSLAPLDGTVDGFSRWSVEDSLPLTTERKARSTWAWPVPSRSQEVLVTLSESTEFTRERGTGNRSPDPSKGSK